jgi:hypothetical protein
VTTILLTGSAAAAGPHASGSKFDSTPTSVAPPGSESFTSSGTFTFPNHVRVLTLVVTAGGGEPDVVTFSASGGLGAAIISRMRVGHGISHVFIDCPGKSVPLFGGNAVSSTSPLSFLATTYPSSAQSRRSTRTMWPHFRTPLISKGSRFALVAERPRQLSIGRPIWVCNLVL